MTNQWAVFFKHPFKLQYKSSGVYELLITFDTDSYSANYFSLTFDTDLSYCFIPQVQ